MKAIVLVILALACAGGKANAKTPLHRTRPLSYASLGFWWGTGCPDNGRCACSPTATTMQEEASCQLDALAKHDFPVDVFLFDGNAWSKANSFKDNQCRGEDCCEWKLGDGLIDRMKAQGVRAVLHFWGGCHQDEQYERAHRRLGKVLLGFYLDDGSSDAEASRASAFLARVAPGDSDVVCKAIQGRDDKTSEAFLSSTANVSYVGDTHYDWQGLKDGIKRFFTKGPLLPAAFNELTGYWYPKEGTPDEETVYRRLHWGAVQPIMAHTPFANMDPWQHGYSAELLAAYRRWAWWHKELTPYIYSLSIAMHENPAEPVIRNASLPNESMQLGPNIFAAFVSDPKVSARDVQLPPGRWIDVWNEDNVLSGRVKQHPAKPGFEPVFIKEGALLPLQVARPYADHGTRASADSLTLLAYPAGKSTFRYRDHVRNQWHVFTLKQQGPALSLDAAPRFRRLPVLLRLGRQKQPPQSVGIKGGRLLVNATDRIAALPQVATEDAVNAAGASCWFFDAQKRRLIVKWVP